jgi:hypothetical protein
VWQQESFSINVRGASKKANRKLGWRNRLLSSCAESKGFLPLVPLLLTLDPNYTKPPITRVWIWK